MPMVHLPAGALVAPGPKPVAPLPRKEFGREVKEFTKTAKKIAEDPWNLARAAQYITTLLAENQAEQNPDHLPSLSVYAEHIRTFVPLLPDAYEEWRDFAPGTPKMVKVEPKAPPRRRIRGKHRGQGDVPRPEVAP
eukprot:1356134-Pyramimonas_sp.AAC.1